MESEDLNLGRDAAPGPPEQEEAGVGEADTGEAAALMARDCRVHGFGIGHDGDGAACVVLFAAGMPADQVPETLDGLPVRVEDSDHFVAGG